MSSHLDSSLLLRLDFGQCLELIKSPKVEDRVKGCLALQRTNHKEARRILSLLAAKDKSDRVRQAAKRLLSLEVDEKGEAEVLGLSAKAPRLRLKAARELCKKGDRNYLPTILQSLQCEGSPVVKAALIKALGKLDGKHQIRTLRRYVNDSDPRVRLSSVNALIDTRSQLAYTLVFQRFDDDDELVRQRARDALNILGTERALVLLTNMSKADQAWLRETAAQVLGFIDSDTSLELLEDFADDPVPHVRKSALASLRELAQRGCEEAQRIAELISSKVSEASALESSLALEELVEAPLRTIATDLASNNPFVRLKAVNAVASREDSDELQVLTDHLVNEENEYVLSRILTIVGLLGQKENSATGSLIMDFINHSDERVVANAIEAATKLELSSLRRQIRPYVVSENSRLRANALLFLADSPNMDIAKELSSMSLHSEDGMHLSAIYLVEQLAKERKDLVAQLTPICQSQSGPVHFSLLEALERLAESGNDNAARLLRTARGEGLGLSTVMSALRVERASYRKRLVAFCIDGFVTFWLFWILFIVITLFSSVVAVIDKETFARVFQSNTALLALAYVTLLFTRDGFFGGRGFGKRWLGLRIIDIHTGRGCGFFRSLLRQATFGLPLLNIVEAILPAFDKRGQRLIDKLLGTEVIDEKKKDITVFQWIAALPGLFFIITILLLIALGLFIAVVSAMAGGKP